MNKAIGFLVLSFFFIKGNAQNWKELKADYSVNFYDVVNAAEKHFENNKKGKGSGWKGFQRWVVENEYKYYPSGDRSTVDPYFVKHQYEKFAVNSSKLSALAGWKELGPKSPGQITGHYAFGMGRVACFYVNPNDTQRLYIGSRTGGFWKSLDGGTTWAGGSTDFLAACGVNTIAVSPTNPDTVLININNSNNHYSHGIYQSVNGGDSWGLSNFNPTNLGWGGLGSNREIYKIKYHPTIANLIFVGTRVGMYRSADNLASWTIPVANDDFTDIDFHPTNPNIMYAYAKNNPNVVYVSNDAGVTFITTAIPGSAGSKGTIQVSTVCPDCVYYMSGDGLWKSINNGVSFALVSTPNQSNAGFAVSDTNDDNILAGYLDAFFSTDGGQNFNQVTYWSLGNTNGAGSGHQVSYNTSTNYIHADLQAAECINGVFYAVTDGFLVNSPDNGVNWNILSEDIGIRMNYNLGVSQSNHDRTIVGSQDNGTSVNTESGWVEMYGADGMEGLIQPLNDDWMIGSWQFGGRIITHDAGESISTVTPGGEDGYWIAPIFYDPNEQMKIYSLAENVYTSDNFGSTWTNIGSPSFTGTIKFATIAENNSNIIVAVQNEKMELSSDGGVSWADIKGALPNYSITDVVFDPLDDNTIVVTYARYQVDNAKVFITHDQGVTWQNITYNLGNMPVRSVVIDHTDASTIYLGTEIGLYKKAMEDNTWSLYNSDLPNTSIKELEIMWGSNTIRASTWGRGLWEYDVFGRGTYPSITNTEISSRVTNEAPKEGVDQFVTSIISYDSTITSAYVEWSINTSTFGNVIPMSNTAGDTWVSDTPLPDYPVGTKLFFKVFAVGDNSDTTETYKFMYTVKPFEYCATSGESSSGNLYLSQVDIAAMSNTSVNDAYTYNSGALVELDVNQSYAITLTANTSWTSNDLGAWIDFNADGVFEASELIISDADTGNSATANFTVPASAKVNEILRMRVRLGYWDSPVFDPCGTTLGEVEDYPVMISNTVLSNTDYNALVDSYIHVSPNPTNGQIHIKSDTDKINGVKLFDIRGRLILEKSIYSNELILNLEGLSDSLYLLSIDMGGTTVIKKIIKQ
ncbi:MAG: hypothetical protein COA88_02460 [Kordia sp.]|nr:MAG: hypothetical protein COA88_02460 [Kordia sp.]